MKKNPLLSYQFWENVDLSQDQTSTVIDIRYQDNITAQVNMSGAPNGTLYVQGSNDYKAAPFGAPINSGTWINISDAVAVVSASGNIVLEGNQLGCHFVRFFWDFSSGTGTANGFVVGKQV